MEEQEKEEEEKKVEKYDEMKKETATLVQSTDLLAIALSHTRAHTHTNPKLEG